MPTAYPWFHNQALAWPTTTVPSGCSLNSAAAIPCSPESMRASAEAWLHSHGYLVGQSLSQDAYSLARHMSSEVGNAKPEEMVTVGEGAVNRGKLKGESATGLLTTATGAGAGLYGEIQGGGTGRWAATSRDPSVRSLLLGDLIASGQTNFSGSDDQDGLEYNGVMLSPAYFPDPAGKVKSAAAAGNFWVGPLAGVDHWHTFAWKYYGVNHPDAASLLARGLWAVQQPRPVWPANMPTEAEVGGLVGIVAMGAAGYFLWKVIQKRRAEAG